MQIFPLRLLPIMPNFNFIAIRKISYLLSALLLVLSMVLICFKGFNWGIDFIGGITVEVRTDQEPDLTKMRTILGNLGVGEVVLQTFGSSRDLSIKLGVDHPQNLTHNITIIKQALSEHFAYQFEYRKVDFVGPQVGQQMIKSGIIATFFAFFAIMIYVWIRFEWHFGLCVLIALLHDVVLSLGFMSMSNYDFNLSTVAAILTIIGYSVNNSVVIYDRVRENMRKYHNKTILHIINTSINETLSRTTITAFTTLLANLALILLGGEAIKSFSSLVFFGIFIGTYSSIFIASPILTIFSNASLNRT